MSEPTSRPPELPLGRLEAFSDGVFAIAITLLVLELAVDQGAEADLVRGILEQWPSYLAYATSFLTIGAVWILHSTITGALRAADGTLYRLNLRVLLVVSFLPFPTRLVGVSIENEDAERVASAFYGLTLLVLSLAFMLFVRYAARERRLVKEHIPEADLAAAARSGPSLGFYAVAIAVSIVLPVAAVAMYLAIAIYLTVPASAVRRVLRQPG